MTMNPLPPQAYTKETLLKAYQWLTGQNSSLKEIATTPDILVSLYLKATRDGDEALERPSIKNFKTELKSLAGIMGELDRAPQANPSTYASSPLSHPATASASASAAGATSVSSTPTPVISSQATQVSYSEKTVTTTTRSGDIMECLDAASRGMIHEVKEEFNLSSDIEALRLLLKVGYKRSRSLLS
ncbi:MAG: hypothetical protein AAGB31_13765 [Bdellovibrio sp.]